MNPMLSSGEARLARPPVRTWLIAIGSGLLTACASMHTAIPELPQATPQSWAVRQATAGGLAPDIKDWWHAFDDPTLNGLVERALQENLTIQMAGERLKAARALRHRSRADYWPNLNFRLYEETAPAGTTGYLEIGFDSSWEFGFFGRSTATSRIALADENTAIIEAAAAQVSVIAEVVKNYIELRAAQARAKIFDDLVRVRRRQIELSQARLRAHLAPAFDVDRAQNELEQVLSDGSEPALAIVQTEQALAVLLGTNSVDPVLQTIAAQPHLPAILVSQSPADLLRTRPEIRRAEQNVIRTAGELGVARADLYPKLGLVGTLISSTATTGDLDRPNKAVPAIGPAITIPLLDWGTRRDVVKAREAALAAGLLAYREAVLESVAEAQTALSQFEIKTQLLANAETTVRFNERAAQSARKLQTIGLGDGLDDASAQLALTQARLQRSLGLRERALSYVALYKAFGGNLPPLLVADHAKHDSVEQDARP